jgi:hypothetical protein
MNVTIGWGKEALLKEKVSTADPLVQSSLEQQFLIQKIYIDFFYKTSYLYEEVNCTEPSPSVRVPWLGPIL